MEKTPTQKHQQLFSPFSFSETWVKIQEGAKHTPRYIQTQLSVMLIAPSVLVAALWPRAAPVMEVSDWPQCLPSQPARWGARPWHPGTSQTAAERRPGPSRALRPSRSVPPSGQQATRGQFPGRWCWSLGALTWWDLDLGRWLHPAASARGPLGTWQMPGWERKHFYGLDLHKIKFAYGLTFTSGGKIMSWVQKNQNPEVCCPVIAPDMLQSGVTSIR